MVLTNSNIINETFLAFYDLIDNNVSDPNGKSKWIYSTEPENILETKASYPIITIEHPDINSSEIVTLDSSVRVYGLEVEVTIFSTSKQQLANISDSVFNAIESNYSTLNSKNIDNIIPIGSSTDTVKRGNVRVHTKTFVWSYDYNRDSS